MLKGAILALENTRTALLQARDRAHMQFQRAVSEADLAAAERDVLDQRVQEIDNGLLLLKNSDGLLEKSDMVPGPDDNNIDKFLDHEIKKLLE